MLSPPPLNYNIHKQQDKQKKLEMEQNEDVKKNECLGLAF